VLDIQTQSIIQDVLGLVLVAELLDLVVDWVNVPGGIQLFQLVRVGEALGLVTQVLVECDSGVDLLQF